jgi:hypothetical protein
MIAVQNNIDHVNKCCSAVVLMTEFDECNGHA